MTIVTAKIWETLKKLSANKWQENRRAVFNLIQIYKSHLLEVDIDRVMLIASEINE